MKIVDQNKMKPESVTTLNDIPVGAIFRGSVMGACSGEWASGVFYKATGPMAHFCDGKKVDFVIVRLDRAGVDVLSSGSWANAWFHCAAVKNYQPLDVELVIKGAL